MRWLGKPREPQISMGRCKIEGHASNQCVEKKHPFLVDFILETDVNQGLEGKHFVSSVGISLPYTPEADGVQQ